MRFHWKRDLERQEYIEYAKTSIQKAKYLNCPYLVVHSDALTQDGSAKRIGNKLTYEEKTINLFYVLNELAPVAEKGKICLVIEPLNSTCDHKQYFLDKSQIAFDIIKSIGSEYIKVLYDIYHMQIMEGNIISTIESNIDSIGYIHIADVPGRHEPGTGEINYHNILKVLKRIGYDRMIGFELEPLKNSSDAVKSIVDII